MTSTGDIPQLTSLLNSSVFGEDDRDIDTNAPLGEDGVGLDSLGLVEFLTAIETEFGVEIPTEVWDRADQLTLAGIAATLRATSADG